MDDNDLISRAAAIDALTDQNIEKNFDSVYDGELHRTKRAAMRIIANAPTIDAIPVEWLQEKMRGYASALKSTELAALVTVMQMWEQEGR